MFASQVNDVFQVGNEKEEVERIQKMIKSQINLKSFSPPIIYHNEKQGEEEEETPIIYLVQPIIIKTKQAGGTDDVDSLSGTDSGVFSDNDGYSTGRSSPSPVSCKEGLIQCERERFSILTFDQVQRVDSVLNEMVALEGRENFPALELRLKDLLASIRERLLREGLKIRDIRLNGGAASYSLMPEQLEYCHICGNSYGSSDIEGSEELFCSCISPDVNDSDSDEESTSDSSPSPARNKKLTYNDIDLIFGMELSTAKHFDRVKTAVLEALLDLIPPQQNRMRISQCAPREAYVSKMVKVCEGDRWSLIALGKGQPSGLPGDFSGKGRPCSVELKFVDNMRRQYEFSVDSFQIVLDGLMLFYKCATVPMSNKFYPTVVGESVYGDFTESLFHLQHGLISTRHPEEIRGGGLLKYCNLLVRGYRHADTDSVKPLQRYMCSRFFIDFPHVEQQEIKLKTYLANHMSGAATSLRYSFLVTLYQVVDSSTVCLMVYERNRTLELIQRLSFELFTNDCQPPEEYPKYSEANSAAVATMTTDMMYPASCYSPTFYMPQSTLVTNSPASAIADSTYQIEIPDHYAETSYYPVNVSGDSSSTIYLANPPHPLNHHPYSTHHNQLNSLHHPHDHRKNKNLISSAFLP